jgi:hypothetical protein
MIEKKLEALKEFKNNNPTKQLWKMSPLISGRTLNNLAEKSSVSSNSVVNTPKMDTSSGSKTARDSLSKTLSDEGGKNEEVIKAMRNLQTAKKEIEILESLKTMSNEIYDICNRSKSYKYQIKIFEMYLKQL